MQHTRQHRHGTRQYMYLHIHTTNSRVNCRDIEGQKAKQKDDFCRSAAMFSSIKNTAGWLSKLLQAFVIVLVKMPKMVADN